jgi:hypothetical protein
VEESGPNLVRARAATRLEHEKSTDRHRHPTTVDGEVEDVVGPRTVDEPGGAAAHSSRLGGSRRRGHELGHVTG